MDYRDFPAMDDSKEIPVIHPVDSPFMTLDDLIPNRTRPGVIWEKQELPEAETRKTSYDWVDWACLAAIALAISIVVIT